MTTVYVVTSGEYSSYGIESIYTTRVAAESFVDLHSHAQKSFDIEEFQLDQPHNPENLCKGYVVTVDVNTGEQTESPIPVLIGQPSSRHNGWYGYTPRRTPDGRWMYDKVLGWGTGRPVCVSARHHTVDQALKAARDFATQWKAQQEGL